MTDQQQAGAHVAHRLEEVQRLVAEGRFVGGCTCGWWSAVHGSVEDVSLAWRLHVEQRTGRPPSPLQQPTEVVG